MQVGNTAGEDSLQPLQYVYVIDVQRCGTGEFGGAGELAGRAVVVGARALW
ncbi:hypothetical protein [Mycobacterium sp. Root265]|uniref:hypothetical protein n=1 Tax=Mycobacterium sp. Root265 TaxID=1736504 RepID=UPI000B307398